MNNLIFADFVDYKGWNG